MDALWALGSSGRVGEGKMRFGQLNDHRQGLFTGTGTQSDYTTKLIYSLPEPTLPTDPKQAVVASTMPHLSSAVTVIFSLIN